MKKLVLLLMVLAAPAQARDLGQWSNVDPELSEWFRTLMQPDQPGVSCCGNADAYWCDEIHVKNGRTFCAITDDRDDGPLGRPHLPIGTVIEIPRNKIKWDRGNPTGHTVVFLSAARYVYCFVQNGGV
jgi:hypothetical protein